MKKDIITVFGAVLVSVSMSACANAPKGNEAANEVNTESETEINAQYNTEANTETEINVQSQTIAEENEARGESSESGEDTIGIIKEHQQITSTEGYVTFTEIVDKSLADGQGYTNLPIGDTDALIVATSTFSGNSQDNAAEAEIFVYEDSLPKYIGCVKSGGSANPLATKDSMIFTVGHHYVGKHTIANGTLLTVEEAWETFDDDGNVTYHYNSNDGEDHSNIGSDAAKELYNKLSEEYYETEVIGFDTIKR